MTTWLYCGRCGKKLDQNSRKSLMLGFCAKCRTPPLDGQLALDGSVVKRNPTRTKRRKQKAAARV